MTRTTKEEEFDGIVLRGVGLWEGKIEREVEWDAKEEDDDDDWCTNKIERDIEEEKECDGIVLQGVEVREVERDTKEQNQQVLLFW